MIKEYFNRKDLHYNINPDEAIAYGATVAAYVETSFNELEIKDNKDNKENDEIKIIDKVTFPIGIEVNNGKMITIIPKSTKLPDKGETKLFSKTFMPTKDYSKGYIVNIFEGESEFVIDNHLLGKFTVVGIPYNVKEKTIVKINLYIDHDSILTVVAKTNDVENKKIIIKKENMYNEDDMKRFKENMIDFEKKDEMRKSVAKDLNEIVDLNNQLKKKCSGSNLGDDDKNIIKRKYSEIDIWVRKNEEPTKIECENKIKEINDFTKKYF